MTRRHCPQCLRTRTFIGTPSHGLVCEVCSVPVRTMRDVLDQLSPLERDELLEDAMWVEAEHSARLSENEGEKK